MPRTAGWRWEEGSWGACPGAEAEVEALLLAEIHDERLLAGGDTSEDIERGDRRDVADCGVGGGGGEKGGGGIIAVLESFFLNNLPNIRLVPVGA